MQRPRRIAIDGPAGSGKSTIGEQLARHLGYLYIDTGAFYRALAWLALASDIDVNDGPSLAQLALRAEITISRPLVDDGRQYTVKVHGQDVTWAIRSPAVTQAVSITSAHKEVRAIIIAQQRAMAQRAGVVMVGRDIGSVVLPDAELKIFLTASLAERARRRFAELVERLGPENPDLPDLEAVMQDIERRDYIDRNNLHQVEDAIVINTDSLSVEQALEIIYQHIPAEL
jgi:CMP/dCMP kinase